jgi:putative ABC transport system ATP-binding protein
MASAEILALLRRAVDVVGQTVVMVSHDPNAAAIADRILFLTDGRIVRELPQSTPEAIIDAMTALSA